MSRAAAAPQGLPRCESVPDQPARGPAKGALAHPCRGGAAAPRRLQGGKAGPRRGLCQSWRALRPVRHSRPLCEALSPQRLCARRNRLRRRLRLAPQCQGRAAAHSAPHRTCSAWRGPPCRQTLPVLRRGVSRRTCRPAAVPRQAASLQPTHPKRAACSSTALAPGDPPAPGLPCRPQGGAPWHRRRPPFFTLPFQRNGRRQGCVQRPWAAAQAKRSTPQGSGGRKYILRNVRDRIAPALGLQPASGRRGCRHGARHAPAIAGGSAARRDLAPHCSATEECADAPRRGAPERALHR